MAPEFALFLSPDGIALAHRQPAGHWAVLSDTALDVPDLPAALAAMRQQAEDRAGPGFATLVILPDDQILFTSLTAPGPEDADRLAQIHDGLDGLTPYTISDLAFDYVPLEDGRVKLAVVARETLAEAEGFARENGFEPAGFAARPLDNRFPGVAHFDRSPDWTKSISDIEFGHDSWQKASDKPDDAIEVAAASEKGAADAAPEASNPPEGGPSPDAPDADPAAMPAPTPPNEPATAPDEDPSLARDAEPEARTIAAAKDSPSPRPEQPDRTDPIVPDGPDVETPAAASPAQPGAPGARDNAAQVSARDEPLQMPSGFGAGRTRDATPDDAVDRVGARPSRLAIGSGDAAPPEPARAPAGDPEKTRARPRFGRGRSKSAAAATDMTPKRPEAAGPAPDLPPLARTKLRTRRKSKDKTTPPPRPDLPSPGPEISSAGTAPDHAARPSARDRLSGMGKRLSAGAEKARDTASGLSARRKPDTGTGSAAGSAGRGSISARLKSLGRKGQASVAEGPEAGPGSGDAGQPKAIPIAPPPRPAVTERAAAATPPALTDADTSLTGGMLGRGLRSGGRGPSLRAGLILTLILLAVLGLIAIWAVFYLPDTALARWLGIERQEAGIEQVGPAPQISDGPQLSAIPPQGDETAPGVTSLTPEASAPQVTGIPPQTPDLLPDIDADLDLGPMPVADPRVDPETLLPTIAETEDFYARTGIWQRPPVIDLPIPETVLEGVNLPGIDPQVASVDAYALPVPRFDPAADLPRRQSSPVDPATAFVFDENGLVVPTPEGTLNPDGILVIAGAPVVTPVPRPGDAPAATAAPDGDAADPTAGAIDTALLGTRRPPGRPAGLQEQRERAVLGGITFAELGRIRPEGRPASIQELAAAEAQAAHDQADAAAEPAAVASASERAVAVSFVPRARPGNIDEIVQTARAAAGSGATAAVGSTAGAGTAVAPVAASVSDTVVPDIPSSASVTRAATRENAINLHRINLIGVTGSDSDRRALVRLPSGRFVTVGTGDRLDGGQVAAIGQTTLQYVKSGRTVTLEIPSG